jgi:GAF domain-containing protein
LQYALVEYQLDMDETGRPIVGHGFHLDITDRERLRRETEERLNEINTLYRAMSREAWRDFFGRSGEKAYYFDQNAIQPAGDLWLKEMQMAVGQKSPEKPTAEQAVVTMPITMRGDMIGALAIQVDDQKPLSEEEKGLVGGILEQISLALEGARLFEQTQVALGETQTLYGVISEMNAAGSYDDLLSALSRGTLFNQADQLLLMGVFDTPLAGEHIPEWIYPVAYHAGGAIQIAKRYPLNAFEAKPGTLFSNQPVVIENIANDPRLDRVARTLFQEVFRAKSSVIAPLLLGNEAIGFIQGYFGERITFQKEEMQMLVAVASQAAIAVQSRLLLEQARARARQEQRIREVTTLVFGAADVDSIMRRATEQISRALDRPAFVYLG